MISWHLQLVTPVYFATRIKQYAPRCNLTLWEGTIVKVNIPELAQEVVSSDAEGTHAAVLGGLSELPRKILPIAFCRIDS